MLFTILQLTFSPENWGPNRQPFVVDHEPYPPVLECLRAKRATNEQFHILVTTMVLRSEMMSRDIPSLPFRLRGYLRTPAPYGVFLGTFFLTLLEPDFIFYIESSI